MTKRFDKGEFRENWEVFILSEEAIRYFDTEAVREQVWEYERIIENIKNPRVHWRFDVEESDPTNLYFYNGSWGAEDYLIIPVEWFTNREVVMARYQEKIKAREAARKQAEEEDRLAAEREEARERALYLKLKEKYEDA